MNAGFNVLWFNKKMESWEQDEPEPQKFSSWKNGAELITDYIESLN